MTINVDDVNNDIIPFIYEFKDAFESIFVVSHNWAFNHRRLLGCSDLEVGKIFNNKNNLVNAAK